MPPPPVPFPPPSPAPEELMEESCPESETRRLRLKMKDGRLAKGENRHRCARRAVAPGQVEAVHLVHAPLPVRCEGEVEEAVPRLARRLLAVDVDPLQEAYVQLGGTECPPPIPRRAPAALFL